MRFLTTHIVLQEQQRQAVAHHVSLITNLGVSFSCVALVAMQSADYSSLHAALLHADARRHYVQHISGNAGSHACRMSNSMHSDIWPAHTVTSFSGLSRLLLQACIMVSTLLESLARR